MKARVTPPEIVRPSPHISAAVIINGMVYVSGQGPINLAERTVVRGTIDEETTLTIQNIASVLREAGCDLRDVVRCTCYLHDLSDFTGFNATYRALFEGEIPPARTTVEAKLLQSIKIEIDAIACLPSL